VMSLTFAVPHGTRLRRRPIRSARRTRNSYGLVSDRPTRLYSEAPAPATTLDRPVMCTTGGQRGRATFGWWELATGRSPTRSGVVEEVVRGDPSPQYRIRWDD